MGAALKIKKGKKKNIKIRSHLNSSSFPPAPSCFLLVGSLPAPQPLSMWEFSKGGGGGGGGGGEGGGGGGGGGGFGKERCLKEGKGSRKQRVGAAGDT